MWYESQIFKQSSSRKKRTFSLHKNPHNFGMESRIKKIKRSLESALEWLSNDEKIYLTTSELRTPL